MPGLRIHHPTERDCVLIVRHPGRGLRRSNPKDIAIHLDVNGDSIVSTGVWKDLVEAMESGLSNTHRFVILNEVSDPPTIVTGMAASSARQMRTLNAHTDGVEEARLQRVAQTFAPKGVKPRIQGLK